MSIEILYLVDWAIITISFFNTIVMLWLGMTILLNAERRHWGIWVTGGGFLLAALFFVGHSAVVGRVIGTFGSEMEFWWRIGWLPFIAGPYLWYLAIAWYTGVFHTGYHRVWLVAVSLLGLGGCGLLAFANPLPGFDAVIQRSPGTVTSIGGIPVVVLVYPVYSTLCIVLALLALRQPEASERFMGDLGRQRARPWLLAASVVLLGVSLSAGSAAAWFLQRVQAGNLPSLSYFSLLVIIGFDLFISGLIAVATVLMGRAIVSYEIFTGKALPRGGLARHWRQLLFLAAGYSALVGLGLSALLDLHPIYQLLLATVLMTIFVALVNWRAYIHHERSVNRLRPFVASQQLYEHLLHPAIPSEVDIISPFRALCEDVLRAKVGYLTALGPLAPLVGSGLVYPPTSAPLSITALTSLTSGLRLPAPLCLALDDPAQYGGAVWGIPLWSERGLIGLLLLGEKRDGGLYTQEEIEIARATGERLIDTQASAEMARRLMSTQRQRLATGQVIDGRARRILHDSVLPELHMLMLRLSTIAPDAGSIVSETVEHLAQVHKEIAALLRDMPTTVAPDVAQRGLIEALQRTVETQWATAFDQVNWQIAPDAEQTARTIPAITAEVIFFAACEAIRNAARYGRNSDVNRPLSLTISAYLCDGLQIIVEDDGVGMGLAHSTSAGSSQGLALHSTMMAVIGGTLTTESVPGMGTRIVLTLPDDT